MTALVYTKTIEDLVDANLHHWMRGRFGRRLLGAVFAGATLLLALWVGAGALITGGGWGEALARVAGVPFAALGGMVVFYFAGLPLVRIAARRHYAGHRNDAELVARRLTLGVEGLVLETPLEERRLAWWAVERIETGPAGVFLYWDGADCEMVPRRAFADRAGLVAWTERARGLLTAAVPPPEPLPPPDAPGLTFCLGIADLVGFQVWSGGGSAAGRAALAGARRHAIALAGLAALAGAALVRLDLAVVGGAVGGALGLIAVVVAAEPWLRTALLAAVARWMYALAANRGTLAPRRLALEADGIAIVSVAGQRHLAWAALEPLVRVPGAFYLPTDAGSAEIVPLMAFPDPAAAEAFAEDVVRGQGGPAAG